MKREIISQTDRVLFMMMDIINQQDRILLMKIEIINDLRQWLIDIQNKINLSKNNLLQIRIKEKGFF
jgi:hypothetical protein